MTFTKTILGALSLAALPLAADALTWNIQDVVFDDGATVTGSFDYDAATDTYSSVDILYNPGAATIDGVFMNYSGGVTFERFQQATTLGEITTVSLDFSAPLDDAGGTVALSNASRGFCIFIPNGTCTRSQSSSTNGDFLYGTGYVQSSNATVVPLPASIWLLGAALAGLGLRRRVTGQRAA